MTMEDTDKELPVKGEIIVEENAEGTLMSVTSPKRKAKYIIYKPEDGYGMFRIKQDSGGEVAEEISGAYTSRKTALNTLKFYLDHAKETTYAKWDRMFGEEKAPPLKTKNKELKVGATS
jgi:hypothetical protein